MGILKARILEWVAIPFSRASSRPRDRTWVFCTAGAFFTIWATRECRLPWWSGGYKSTLPVQRTQVWSLVSEDSTCWEAAKPQLLSPWAADTEAHSPLSPCSTTREATTMSSPKATMKSSPCSPQLEKVHAQQLSSSRAKNNFFKLKKKNESSIDNLPLRL